MLQFVLAVLVFPAYVVGTKQSVRLDGDIIIGALFPVHRGPNSTAAFTKQCGEIWEEYGIQRIQMLFMTLDEINNSTEILPNITLGCDIRDSCWYAPIALEQTIDFIKDSIASIENQNKNISQKNASSGCSDAKRGKPIAGLIGPGSSAVSIQVQNFFQLFQVPQIGYSATSKDLSKKDMYKYFMRVVPSDLLQAKALSEFVAYHNWSYISAVASEGNYGSSGMNAFQGFIKDRGMCLATSETIDKNAGDHAFDNIVKNLMEFKNAQVVVCFCEGMTVRALFEATKRMGADGYFTIIGSDGWNDRNDVVENIEAAAAGGISIRLHSAPVPGFTDTWLDLKPRKDSKVVKRNPWFEEFWEHKFECNIPGARSVKNYGKVCSGDENLREADFKADAKLGFVVNALKTMARGLDSLQREVCNGVPGVCEGLLPINGTSFLRHLLNVSYTTYAGYQLHFDKSGDPPGRYDFLNFKRYQLANGSYSYKYELIGNWDSGNLTVMDNKVYWPNGRTFVESVCSKPCPKGQVKSVMAGTNIAGSMQAQGQAVRNPCCWVCTPCKENQILIGETLCEDCAQGWWPNEELNACMPIEIQFIEFRDTRAVCSMIFSAFGVFVTLCIIVCFLRHNDTPVVKSSTRELTYIILFGIIISYSTTFALIAKPSISTCYLSRILPGFSFSMIFGALVTKTNRIARILAGSKKKIMTRKPRFMSASAQVVISCMIIGVECAIITVMLVLEPADSTMDYSTKRKVKLICNTTSMGIAVPLGFDLVLIAMCTIYAVRTRNVPENFNEAKFIGFTMYTTCVIWGAFVPIYYGAENRVICMAIAISLSATVALVLLFFPKVYIILCKPERNSRSAFTTAKDIRCHVGNQNHGSRSQCNSLDSAEMARELQLMRESSSGDDLDNCFDLEEEDWQDKAFAQAALDMYRQKNFFDKWKNRSGPREPSPRGRVTFRSRLSAGNIHSTRQGGKPPATPPYRSGGRYESIPMRDVQDSPVPSLRFQQHDRRQLEAPNSPDSNHLNIDRKRARSRGPNSPRMPSTPHTPATPRVQRGKDMSCQTDDDYIEGVRQRKLQAAGSSTSSGQSRSSRPRSSHSSANPLNSYNSQTRDGSAATVQYPPTEGSVGSSLYPSSGGVAPISVHDDDGETQPTDRHPLLNRDENCCDSGSDAESYTNNPETQDYFYDSFIDSGVTQIAPSVTLTPSASRRAVPGGAQPVHGGAAPAAPTAPTTPGQSRGRPPAVTPVIGRGVVPRPSSTGLVISNMFANPKPRTDKSPKRQSEVGCSPKKQRANSDENLSPVNGMGDSQDPVSRLTECFGVRGEKSDIQPTTQLSKV